MRTRSPFSGESRATDGCIATFELEDGTILVERFSQLVFSARKAHADRSMTRAGAANIVQAARRADELGAKIISLSTPQTILTDLRGTRAPLEAKAIGREGLKGGMQQAPAGAVAFPELAMLSKINRLDLFKRPDGGRTDQNIRQVRGRRPSHAGRGDQ